MKPLFSPFLAVATSFFILERSLVSAETLACTSARFDQRYVRQSSFFFAGAAFLFVAVRMVMLPLA